MSERAEGPERAAEEREFLLEAGATLASSLDYTTTLRSVARLVVPRIADWCAVDLLEDGRITRVAVEHVDQSKVAMALRLAERYPDDPATAIGVPEVVRTGEPQVGSEIGDALLTGVARDAEHLRLLRELGLRSYLIVPLEARGEVLGAITLVQAESGRSCGDAELRLAQQLARQAATAIDNARLFAHVERSRLLAEAQRHELEAQADELIARTLELEAQAGEMEQVQAQLEEQAGQLEESTAELERVNREIATSEAQLRAIVDAALDAIVTIDGESRITGWNAQAEAMFGWTEAEALGRTLTDTIIPPRFRGRHTDGIRRYLATGQARILSRRVEMAALRRDGEEFPVELTVAHARTDGAPVFSAFIRDLTERRRTEARLAAEHAVTRALADAGNGISAAVGVLDAIGTALGWDTGFFWMPEGDRLQPRASWRSPTFRSIHFLSASVSRAFAAGEGLPGRVWETGDPLTLADAGQEDALPRAASAAADGLHGALAFPVRTGGDFLGVVEFFSQKPLKLDSALTEMARAIGTEIAQSLQRLRAEEARDHALREANRANTALALRTEEAEMARQVAEDANRAKSDFLAVMSHELRTPLNAIGGYAELLMMGIRGPVNELQHRDLERIQKSQQHLLGLINDVLDLSKIEAGRLGISRERLSSGVTVHAAISLVSTLAEAKEIRLVNECTLPGPSYVGDEDRVRQVLLNLLSNAIKFTPAQGSVTVRCGAAAEPEDAAVSGAGPWICIRVEDTGVGIAPEEAGAVFDPFVQAESGHTRSSGGTGLGLAISRRLSRLMGGDVTLRSALGKGSCFTLWLPATEQSTESTALPPLDLPPSTPGSAPAGLREAAAAIEGQSAGILHRYVSRLRADAAVPTTGRTDAELRDHHATLLVEIGLGLCALADSPSDITLLHDGSEVQRLLSVRHGEQRARLGWDEAVLRRECAILREEMQSATAHAGVSREAWEVVLRFLRRSEAAALGALQGARRS